MYGSGAQIGMAAIARRARQTLRDLQAAAIACSVVVVGAATLSTVAFRIATTTIRRAGTAAAASALFAFHNKTTSVRGRFCCIKPHSRPPKR